MINIFSMDSYSKTIWIACMELSLALQVIVDLFHSIPEETTVLIHETLLLLLENYTVDLSNN